MGQVLNFAKNAKLGMRHPAARPGKVKVKIKISGRGRPLYTNLALFLAG
jgi:hypothetical protein